MLATATATAIAKVLAFAGLILFGVSRSTPSTTISGEELGQPYKSLISLRQFFILVHVSLDIALYHLPYIHLSIPSVSSLATFSFIYYRNEAKG